MQIALQAVIAIIALLLTPVMLFHYDVTPKVAALTAGTSVCLLFFRKGFVHLEAFVSTKLGFWFTCVLLAQLLWAAVATVFSSSVDLSIYGSVWRRFGLITTAALVVLTLLCASRMAGSTTLILHVLRVFVLSGAVLSTYGILQYFGIDPLVSAQSYSAGEGPFRIVRPPGTFGHADYFATWLVIVVFAGVTLSDLDGIRGIRIGSWIVVVLAIVAVTLTGTRAALLGLACGSVALLTMRLLPVRRIAAVLITGLLILTIFVASPGGTRLRARIHWSGDDPRGGARLLIWQDSLRMALERPLVGFGPESFPLVFPRYESAELARAYPDFHHESAHNVLIDELTSSGIPGLLLFLAMMIAVFWPVPQLHRSDRLIGYLSAAVVALFVCQQFSVFVVGTAFAFYLSSAMLVAAKTWPPAIRRPDRVQLICFAVPALALSLAFGIYALELTVGDYELARANASIEQRDPEAAATELAHATRWLPAGPSDDLYFSRSMASLALRSPVFITQAVAWREALNRSISAVKTSEDRQNAWYSLASMLARQNDTAGVERSLRNAIAWAPNWFKPHWKLAEVLALSGHMEEASIEARKAVDLDGGKDSEVTATYRGLINGQR